MRLLVLRLLFCIISSEKKRKKTPKQINRTVTESSTLFNSAPFQQMRRLLLFLVLHSHLPWEWWYLLAIVGIRAGSDSVSQRPMYHAPVGKESCQRNVLNAQWTDRSLFLGLLMLERLALYLWHDMETFPSSLSFVFWFCLFVLCFQHA